MREDWAVFLGALFLRCSRHVPTQTPLMVSGPRVILGPSCVRSRRLGRSLPAVLSSRVSFVTP